eukprot:scaffold16919_cov69-Isochrysis_galbana.AAC.2
MAPRAVLGGRVLSARRPGCGGLVFSGSAWWARPSFRSQAGAPVARPGAVQDRPSPRAQHEPHLGGAIAHARQLSVEDDLRLVVVEDLLAANGAREDPKRPDEEDDQHEKERKVDLLEH